jgi:hypothetical protein
MFRPCTFGATVALLMCLPIQPSIAQEAKPAPNTPAQPQIMTFTTVDIAETDGELTRLLKQRYNAAGEELRARLTLYNRGRTSLDESAESLARFTKAGVELAETPQKQVHALELALNTAQWIENVVQVRFDQGNESLHNQKHAKVVRNDLEIQLHRAREAMKAGARAK